MKNDNMQGARNGQGEPEKIVLAVFPFWDPLVPPMGICCLQGFLKKHGYNIKSVDANIEEAFMDIYNDYFETLKQYIPEDKQSNFYNIGKDVLRNHLMAHINYKDEDEYIRLVKELVFKTFFYNVDGHQVGQLNKISDEFYVLLKDYVLRLLEQEKPGVVGISVFKGSLPASLYTFRLVKEYDPRIRTVMGGGIFADQLAPGSPALELFLEKTPYIDKFIIGEGELLFLKYLRGELPEGKRIYTLGDIQGKTLDISSADVPDFSAFDLRYYPYLGAYTSRSCPFQCNFCSETVRWGVYRKKNPRQVAAELIKLYETYGYQLFLMTDSLLNPTITELSEELLKVEVPLYWDGYLRIDPSVCNIENTFLWRKGGFFRARLGVESGSRRILEMMDKKITPHQIKEAVRNLAHAGIKTTTYWIIGYPGETEEDFLRTFEMVEELKNDIYEAEFNPFWYYEGGQVNSGEWAKKSISLYSETALDMLILPTKILKGIPSREETYRRLKRIIRHCRKLGIPNPYSLIDIYKADERWEKLHKNAVPPLIKFRNMDGYIDDRSKVKQLFTARNSMAAGGDWGF
jgi:radical SAM superfamily enzyme YgiQ (UPF0313 family)